MEQPTTNNSKQNRLGQYYDETWAELGQVERAKVEGLWNLPWSSCIENGESNKREEGGGFIFIV